MAAMATMAAMAAMAAMACDAGTETSTLPYNTSKAIETYSQIVFASYEDSLLTTSTLNKSIQIFISEPNDQTMIKAKEDWLASRETYLQTEVYRFYDGPIDEPDRGPEGMMNAWPLDEAYVDYVNDDISTGIINDRTIPINATNLESLNEYGGEENIATGFHAIEFLLWGQDTSAIGPGDRPYTDYLTNGNGTATNQDRRGRYLSTVTSMLEDHFESIVSSWIPHEPENYRAQFENLDNPEAIRRILTGMIILSGFETGGERLQTALDSGDQEDEHSCFSDNTHRDMVQDIQGVLNIWLGSYTRIDGSTISGIGIVDIVKYVEPELATKLGNRIVESLELANKLSPPFDQEISLKNIEGRARVQRLINSLRDQENLLQDVFQRFELTIPDPD